METLSKFFWNVDKILDFDKHGKEDLLIGEFECRGIGLRQFLQQHEI